MTSPCFPGAGQELASPLPAALPGEASHAGHPGVPQWVALGWGYTPDVPGQHPSHPGQEQGSQVVHLGGVSEFTSHPPVGCVISPLLCQEGWHPHIQREWGQMSLGWCSAVQGLVPAPAMLAGRGFLFHAEAATNEVSGFSWKPWPCCAWSSPADKGGQIPEPWQGRVMSPAPPPSPVPKPLLGQPTPARHTLWCLPLPTLIPCLPWGAMEQLGWGAPSFTSHFVGWFWATAAPTTVHRWKWSLLHQPSLWVFSGKSKANKLLWGWVQCWWEW